MPAVIPDRSTWPGRVGVNGILFEGLARMICDAKAISGRVLPTLDMGKGAGYPCCHFDVQDA